MAVLDNIKGAYLVLFNPKMKVRKTFVIYYSREDLKEEIEMVLEVEKNWNEFLVAGKLAKTPEGVYLGVTGSEESIKAEVEKAQALTP